MAALEKDKAALTEETRRLKVDLKKAQEEGQTREAQNQDSSEHPTNNKVTSFLNRVYSGFGLSVKARSGH